MTCSTEKIGYNKYRQINAPRDSLKTFRATYDYIEVDAETREKVGEGDGDSVLVEAVDREAARDIGQDKVVVNTLTNDSNTEMAVDRESPRQQGVYEVRFSVVKGNYRDDDNIILKSGFRLEEDAERWMRENQQLVDEFEEMRVVETEDPERWNRYNEKIYDCSYCDRVFDTLKGLRIHKGHVHE